MQNTFQPQQPDLTSTEPQLIPAKRNITKAVVLSLVGLFAIVTIATASYYLGTQSSTQTTYTETATNPISNSVVESDPTTPITQKPTYNSNWKSYSSTRHGYSFKYLAEPTWFPSLYDEDNAEVAYGAHTITNYNTVGMEEYMDHGIVDWQAFIGDKPAMKIQIAVFELKTTKAEYMQTLVDQENRLVEKNESVAQTKIGSLDTETYEYFGGFKTDDMRVFTFLAFPNDQQVITVGTNFNNITQETDVTKLAEWKNVELLLKSFEFQK